MTKDDKVKTFEKELNLIDSLEIRRFTEVILENVPDYFFKVAASSTGKYHPKYALGDGGLVRHTKAAVKIADELFRMDDGTADEFPRIEKDVIVASLILHDTCKHGLQYQKYADAKHPVYATKLIESVVKEDDQFEAIRDAFFQTKIGRQLTCCIERHMGQWTKDWRTKAEVLVAPQTRMEKFVHLADYLASRKCLEMNFEV